MKDKTRRCRNPHVQISAATVQISEVHDCCILHLTPSALLPRRNSKEKEKPKCPSTAEFIMKI